MTNAEKDTVIDIEFFPPHPSDLIDDDKAAASESGCFSWLISIFCPPSPKKPENVALFDKTYAVN